MFQFLYKIGKPTTGAFRFFVGHSKFCLRVAASGFKIKNFFNPAISYVVFRETYFIGIELFAVMTVSALIIGVVAVGGLSNVLISLNAKESIGAVLSLSLVRNVAPLIVGLLIILRSSTTFILELSMMRASNELKTMQAMGIDLYAYVYMPRVFATLVSVLVLSTYFAFVSIVGGYTLLSFQLDTTLDTILKQVVYDISLSDVASFLIKSVLIGFTAASIPIYTVIEKAPQSSIDIIKALVSGVTRIFFTFLVILYIGELI